MKTQSKIETMQMYVCDVCNRENRSISVIEQCEQNHKDINSDHSYWKQIDNIECSVEFYRKAIVFLKESENKVMIYKTDEAGKPMFVIAPVTNTAFWLNAFKTKTEAIYFCAAIGWKIIK